jgi:hypothetical protein
MTDSETATEGWGWGEHQPCTWATPSNRLGPRWNKSGKEGLSSSWVAAAFSCSHLWTPSFFSPSVLITPVTLQGASRPSASAWGYGLGLSVPQLCIPPPQLPASWTEQLPGSVCSPACRWPWWNYSVSVVWASVTNSLLYLCIRSIDYSSRKLWQPFTATSCNARAQYYINTVNKGCSHPLKNASCYPTIATHTFLHLHSSLTPGSHESILDFYSLSFQD